MDLRYSLRMLTKNPGVTAAAVLSLALGIGANATIFTWVESVLLNPLPGIPEADRLFVLAGKSRNGDDRSLSYPNFRDIRAQATTFEPILQDDVLLAVSDGQEADRAFAILVSGNYFDVLGTRPMLGRAFVKAEDQTPGGAPVLVLSYAYWQRRFGGQASVVGRSVKVNDRPYTIVGVMPADFLGTTLGLAPDAWVPMMQQPELQPVGDRLEARGSGWAQALVRLRDGISLEAANAELETIRAALEREYSTNDGWRLSIIPVSNSPWGAPMALRPVLLVLVGVVAAVLLIACANIANLLLSKAVGRRREIAVRMALGASRGRVVRQLLLESLMLSLLGGAAGLVVAWWSAGLLMVFVPPTDFPINLGIRVDGSVLAFTAMASIATGLVFGLVPALHASSPRMVQALREESGRTSAGAAKHRLRNGLVVAQVALCLVLLVGAGLFLQSLRRGAHLQPGFDPANVVMASFDVFPAGYDRARGLVFQRQLLDRLRSAAGIERAALARTIPLGFSGNSSTGIAIDGYQPKKDEEIVISFNEVSDGYFETLRIPIVAGRSFTERDVDGAVPAAIVNETMARRYWRDGDPVGRNITAGGERIQIVGVAKDGKYRSLSESPRPYMYFPLAQRYRSAVKLHVRSAGETGATLNTIRDVLREMDPDLPITETMPITDHLEQAIFAQRIAATLLGIFGALALTLAGVGLYGVMAYAVSERTHEMGIRLALGARPGELRGMVVASGMKVAAVGLAIGAAGAAAVSRLLTSLLNGVSPTDPVTFAVVLATLAAVAFLAAFIPARRASLVDPIVALRYE
jgi:macrolide transport system ATP-binding/permease protein